MRLVTPDGGVAVGSAERRLTYPEYLLTVLDGLDRAREEAIPREVAYLDRVVSFDGASRRVETATTSGSEGPRRLPVAARRALRLLFAAARVFGLVPAMFAQMAALRQIQRSAARPDALTIAIASNRLPFTDGVCSPRVNLAWLGRSLGDTPDHPVADAIASADCVLLFDPLPLSRYWVRHRACRQERVFIIDGAFLLAQFVVMALRKCLRVSTAVARLRNYHRAARRTGVGSIRRAKRAVGCFATAEAYNAVLGSFGTISGVFFTCNSVLTELLRTDLIARPQCDRIDEIMHGVGERTGERFFARLLGDGRHFDASDKHRFIPQIPSLPLVGVHGSHAAYGGKLAINAYLNRYFYDQLAAGRTVEALIATEYFRVTGGRTFKGHPLVITMFGNFSSWDSIETAAFKAERMLIDRVRSFRSRFGSESIFIYVPHPLQPPALLTPEVLGGDDIVVYPKSIFCWLISDACLSLVSSAMWEAAYFGARAFTPLLDSDGLFTEEYLSLLDHPHGPSVGEFETALEEFLAAAAGADRTSAPEKAEKRVRMMLGREAGGWTPVEAGSGIPQLWSCPSKLPAVSA